MYKIGLAILFYLSTGLTNPEKGCDQIENGFAQIGDPKTLKLSVITKDQAQHLFSTFKNDKTIPFSYLTNGCYARATTMAKSAENKGIQMGKVFTEGRFKIKTSLVPWTFHVAPIVCVMDDEKQTELMVFDPSFFEGPITLAEWKNKLLEISEKKTRPNTQFYFGSRFQYRPKSTKETNKNDWHSDF